MKGRLYNVITLLNNESTTALWDKYTILFNKAWKELANLDPSPLTEDELNNYDTFQNLEHYFSHMGDLVSVDARYLLLPLDETPFRIDANARTITIPSDFSKCGGVRTDNMCEIATFVIDRYFDYQDLSEADIVIQWINAAGEEGFSYHLGLDLESEPGKIRFGWALTRDVTKAAGKVQFSVRFFKKKSGTNDFSYLLNTLPATITIKESLDVDMGAEDVIKENNPLGLFQAFVSNSQNPTYEKPATPVFNNPTYQLPSTAALDIENDNLRLYAQATAADNGNLTYYWHYTPSNDTNVDKIIDEDDSNYEISSTWIKAETFPAERGARKYYEMTSELPVSYSLYQGDWPPAEDVELYEKVSELHIVKGGGLVTGSYKVEAINKSYSENNPNYGKGESGICQLLAPNVIKFSSNVEDSDVIMDKDTKSAILSVQIAEDPNEPELFYNWESRIGDGSEGYISVGENERNYKVTTPGFYRVEVTSKLNRTEETAVSGIWRVVEPVKAPDVEMYITAPNSSSYEEKPLDVDSESGNVRDGFVFGSTGIIKAEVKDEFTQLTSDGLDYKWYVIFPNEKPIEVTADMCGENGIIVEDTSVNARELHIRCIENNSLYGYYCVVTNHLAGRSASTSTFDSRVYIC